MLIKEVDLDNVSNRTAYSQVDVDCGCSCSLEKDMDIVLCSDDAMVPMLDYPSTLRYVVGKSCRIAKKHGVGDA